ncbi:MAG: NAD(+)/NADH kinase, partial [Thioalkalispiraceae bacterium]
MNSKFSKIGLIGKYGDPSVAETIIRLNELLMSRKCEVWLESSTAKAMPEHNMNTADFEKIGKQCDLAITVGGDGTLLHSARSLVNYDVALLGVNLGRLGFLVDVSPDQIEKRLDEVMAGDYVEEQRIMLTATIVNE